MSRSVKREQIIGVIAWIIGGFGFGTVLYLQSTGMDSWYLALIGAFAGPIGVAGFVFLAMPYVTADISNLDEVDPGE